MGSRKAFVRPTKDGRVLGRVGTFHVIGPKAD
ncbi:hypothetical protein NHJ13734_001526, partial [Beauveria thailandica]